MQLPGKRKINRSYGIWLVAVWIRFIPAPVANDMSHCCDVIPPQTTSNNVQEIIEGKVEKRTKGASELDQ